MTERELRKLNRMDLLELLLEQSREVERLQNALKEANYKLAQREIMINRAGTIAEASLLINGVFEAAENACQQYIENIQTLSARQEEICASMEQETRLKCEKMLNDAKQQSDLYWAVINRKVEKLMDSQKGLREFMQGYSVNNQI